MSVWAWAICSQRHVSCAGNGQTLQHNDPQLDETGQYRHPIPPDPISEIWTPEVWLPEMEDKGPYGRWAFTGGSGPASLLIRRLFEAAARIHDGE